MNTLLDKIALPLGIFLIISLVVGGYFIIQNTNSDTPANNQQVTIDISGAITNPGVYTFNSGSIVEDAINKAGGLTDTADIVLIAKTINRAALLNDHGKVYIPNQKEDTVEDQNINVAVQPTSNLININMADLKSLDTLPGIGPITADRIIKYRENKGAFKRTSDLMKVEGISTSKYNKLKDLITI